MEQQTQDRAMTTTEDLESFDSVKKWFAGWERQWEQEMPARDRADKLRPLLALGRSLDKTPDEMIQQCILHTKAGVRKISIKGRRFYWEQIKAVEDQGDRKAANYLRSFFIYNGIMMQAETRS